MLAEGTSSAQADTARQAISSAHRIADSFFIFSFLLLYYSFLYCPEADFPFTSGTRISLTFETEVENGFGLWDDLFTVSGDITFASKEDGTETAPVHVESDFYYDVTGLKVVGDGGFKAGTTASVSVTLPEGAVSAEVYADESGAVRIEDGYADGETPVQVSLENKGAARITAEYLDENGEFVDEDTLTITVF